MTGDVASAVRIRPFQPEDALALAECFRRCYGESYVVAEFYDPEATARRAREGVLRSVVAESEAGEIVGHMGLAIRHPDARTVDAGNSIVDPRYRGHRVVAKLGLAIRELCTAGGFLGFHHYPTTVHQIMQKWSVMTEGFEIGIMLGYIPSGTDYREIEGSARQDRPAVTVVYNPLAPTPSRAVWVPERYAEIVGSIYASGNLPREPRLSSVLLPESPSHLEQEVNVRRGLLRISMVEAGSDLGWRVQEIVERSTAEIAQIDLRMDDPAIANSVEVAREAGFRFCAVLPEWRQGDWLRLQRAVATHKPFSRPDLANDTAKQILAFIESDGALISPS